MAVCHCILSSLLSWASQYRPMQHCTCSVAGGELRRTIGLGVMLPRVRDQALSYPKETDIAILAPLGSCGFHFGAAGTAGTKDVRIGLSSIS